MNDAEVAVLIVLACAVSSCLAFVLGRRLLRADFAKGAESRAVFWLFGRPHRVMTERDYQHLVGFRTEDWHRDSDRIQSEP